MPRHSVTVVIDPKGDRGLFARAAAEANRHHKPFGMVSTAFRRWSDSFNPLASAETPAEIVDRIRALTPESREPFFESFSLAFVRAIATAQQRLSIPWTLKGLYDACVIRGHMECLIDQYLCHLGCPFRPAKLEGRIQDYEKLGLGDHTAEALINFYRWPREHYQKVTGTLVPTFDGVVGDEVDALLSPTEPGLTWRTIITEGMVVYFAFGSMLIGETANRISRATLQDLVGYLGRRYAYEDPATMSAITVLIDEFGDVVYPEFISALNKAGGANVRFILAMQSRADTDAKLGSEQARRVFDNLNTRLWFRLADEKTAEVAMHSVTATIALPEKPSMGLGYGGLGGLTGHTQQRMRTQEVPLIPPALLTALPVGEFFGRKGGVWWKGRAPLLTPVPPATLDALGIADMWRAMDPTHAEKGDVCDLRSPEPHVPWLPEPSSLALPSGAATPRERRWSNTRWWRCSPVLRRVRAFVCGMARRRARPSPAGRANNSSMPTSR